MAAISARTFGTVRVTAQAVRREQVDRGTPWTDRFLFVLGVCARILFAPMPLRTGESKPNAEIEQAFTWSLRGID